MVAWYLITKLVLGRSAVRAELGLVRHSKELALPLGNVFEPSPSRFLKQTILLCINRTGYWVISCNGVEWLIGLVGENALL